MIDKYWSLNKLLHVVAYCLRFYYNILHKNSKLVGILSTEEINKSRICIIKCVQKKEFSSKIKDLMNTNNVAVSSKLFRLCPFMDENKLIRVGGRLKKAATLDVYHRHPIVLPADCHFTRLLFQNEHERCMHGGP